MNQISQTMNQAGKRNDSKSRKSPVSKKRYCMFCNKKYTGVGKSIYCSKSCNEKACRRRREALVEALAALMVDTSCEVTAILYGVSFQITYDLAYSKAEDCIRHRRKPAELKLKQLGYVYSESLKAWQLQARLPLPLAG